jgi:putative glutamine amidotransferase
MAGGIPVLIPIIDSRQNIDFYINKIDGLLLTGGEDVSPIMYGENPTKEVTQISPQRDEQEYELFLQAYIRNLPVLGICRGVQLMNSALGGTLYQDIYTQRENSLGHCPMDTPVDNLYHSVKINKESKLYSIFQKEEILVNSFHHQSLKDISKEFTVSAMSSDGIVEGIENVNRKFAIGVQWHPEDLTKKYPEFLKLFDAFTASCKY